MTYLYYDEADQEQYQNDQNLLIQLIEESQTTEEKEYFQRALMIFRLFGSVFI